MLTREISVLILEICPLKPKKQFLHIPAKFSANTYDMKYRYEYFFIVYYVSFNAFNLID
jgi:hypothetical protein